MAWLWLLPAVPLAVARTVTVDDTDTNAIQYNPQACGTGTDSWMFSSTPNTDDHMSIGGTIRYCNQENATATLQFIGTDVTVMGPLWPYPMNFTVTLDGMTSSPVSVYDTSVQPPVFNGDATVSSMPLWSKSGLANTSHTLVIGGGDSYNGNHDLFIDAINYTIPDGTTSTSTAPSASSIMPSSSSSVVPSSPSSSGPNVTAVALGSALGAVVLGITAFCLWRHCRKPVLRTLRGSVLDENRHLSRPNLPLLSLTTSHSALSAQLPVSNGNARVPLSTRERAQKGEVPASQHPRRDARVESNGGELMEGPRSQYSVRDVPPSSAQQDTSGLLSSAHASPTRSRVASTSLFDVLSETDRTRSVYQRTSGSSWSRVDSTSATTRLEVDPFADHPIDRPFSSSHLLPIANKSSRADSLRQGNALIRTPAESVLTVETDAPPSYREANENAEGTAHAPRRLTS